MTTSTAAASPAVRWSRTPSRVGLDARVEARLVNELVEAVLLLRVFAPGQREPMTLGEIHEHLAAGRHAEALLAAVRATGDPGTDIFDGRATGFGTPEQRALGRAAPPGRR